MLSRHSILQRVFLRLIACLTVVAASTNLIAQQTEQEQPTDKVSVADVVVAAFAATHEGFSSDEVLLQDKLNQAFVAECKKQLPAATEKELNWKLLNLRKAGKLKHIKTTRRVKSDTSQVTFVAEIAARNVQDKHKVSTDTVMADPKLRKQFDQQVRKLSPKADLYLARKSAFQLRKTRRLKPELITRIADWKRTIDEFPLDDVRKDFGQIPELPGIYIFRDATGYLYIGQSGDLRERLKEHLDESSNEGLGKYLIDTGSKRLSIEIHSFPTDSRAKNVRVRRAYESELIRSRKPRFNISP